MKVALPPQGRELAGKLIAAAYPVGHEQDREDRRLLHRLEIREAVRK